MVTSVFPSLHADTTQRLEPYKDDNFFLGDTLYLALHLKDGSMYVLSSDRAGKIKDEIQAQYKRVKAEQEAGEQGQAAAAANEAS